MATTINLVSVLTLAIPFTVGDPAAAGATTTAIGVAKKGWSNSISAGGFSAAGSYGGSFGTPSAKKAPGEDGAPQFILWSYVPPITSAAFAHKRILLRARCDASSQYWYTQGAVGDPLVAAVPSPYNTDAILAGNYNARNSTTDLADITPEEKAARNTQACKWVARTFCDRQYWQGLIRGKGYAKGGLAGGCLDVPWGYTHFGDGSGYNVARKFATLMYDPRDACAKSQLVTTASGTRTITLPNRDYNGGIPGAFLTGGVHTKTNADALAALNFAGQQQYSVRHTGYGTLWMANGIAENVALNTELAYWIRTYIDHYVPYGMTDADAVELCEPAIVLVDNEESISRMAMPNGSFRAAANGYPYDLYEQGGNFWNAREDSRYGSEVIMQAKSGGTYSVNKTFRQAVLDDPLIAALDTANAPVETSNQAMTNSQIYAFDRLNQNAICYGIKQCMAPLVAEFPGLEVSNYDSMEVADFDDPFVRVGGGWQSHQSLNPLDYDSPSCYGRTVGATVDAIKNATNPTDTAAAVEAWKNQNRAEVLAVTDKVASGRRLAPYLFGPTNVAQLQAGMGDGDFGGDKDFFKETILDHVDKGNMVLPIYGGTGTETVDALIELCDEQGW